MHSSHGRSRRHHIEDDDGMPLPVSRADEHRPESYSRPHNHSSRSEGGINHSSNRSTYTDSTPRAHRVDDWRPAESAYPVTHDHYPNDTYPHARREDYHERAEHRNGEHWQPRPSSHTQVQYSSSSREWQKPAIDHNHAAPSYESRSWTVSARYDDPRNGYEQWPAEEPRPEPERARYDRDDGYSQRENWRREEAIWSEGSEARDRGWADRRDEQRRWATSNYERPQTEDRAWEPAPTWKTGGRDGNRARNDSHQATRNGNGKKSKGNYGRKGQQGHQKRRLDDNMNNWQRRDTVAVSNPNAVSGKRRNTFSRSRSRSPALSSYSHRSSARSRSRSLSPKPRRPDQRVSGRIRSSPSPRATPRGKQHVKRTPNASPQKSRRHEDLRGRPRHSSPSSLSSRSRSRSRSESPDDRPKVRHRLPPATSIHDIKIKTNQLASGFQSNNGRVVSRQKEELVPSHDSTTGRLLSNVAPTASASASASASMPPPSSIPTSPSWPHPAIAASPRSQTQAIHDASAPRLEDHPSTNAVPSVKKRAGFKPIGLNNAAIRKFFPGDEDDNTPDSSRGQSPPSPHLPTSTARGERPVDNHAGRKVDTPFRRGGVPENGESPSGHELVHKMQLHDTSPALRSRREEFSEPPRSSDVMPMGRGNDDGRERNPTSEPNQAARALSSKDELYAIVSQVGEGTFGKVYKAQNTVTGVHVALKRIRMEAERDGFPVTAMREIKLLQSLRHDNVVRLYEMMVSNGSVYMVFEYMDHDLTGVLSQTQFSFNDSHLKSLCQQMLKGLAYLHHKGVIHRDIKGSNILINNRGELKLADFGLARFYQKRRRSDYTNRVITLWYRPPELLLGTTVYGPEVDMWSAGCIMLELFCKKPVFQGLDEINQLDVIYKLMGTPTPQEWPGLSDMPWYELVKPKESMENRFRHNFQRYLSPAGLDLAERLLTFDPMQRVTAAQALEARYFMDEQPPPLLPVGLSTLEGEWHEFESKRERAKKRRKLDSQPQPGSVPQ